MSLKHLRSQEAIDNLRRRDREKKARKVARKKAERLAGLKASGTTVSKTSPAYRNIHFGRAPEMTKAQMRAELTAAVMNTAAQQWGAA